MPRILLLLVLFAIFVKLSTTRAPAGPWDAYNYAPLSKTVTPVSVHSVVGAVNDPDALISNPGGLATFSASNSYVTLDFGKEVGGIVSLNIEKATFDSSFSLSFTESPLFINPNKSDDTTFSSEFQLSDGVEHVPPPLTRGRFTQPAYLLRGGFRYLTIVSNADSPLAISNVSVSITFSPHLDDLRNYTGYFFAEDPLFQRDKDFLTKLWYAGAYTVQTNTIYSDQGRQSPALVPAPGWANNASLGPVDGVVLVDGAKRDRNIWPGDMGISTHTQLVSTNDLIPTKNSLQVMFTTQNTSNGGLNYAGPPINAGVLSDTYISWTLIGTHSYFLYTGDLDFVKMVWANYTKAVAFLANQVDETNLMDVPEEWSNDWGRVGGTGHNSAADALMYQTLVTASDLARHLNDTALQKAYASNATALKKAYNRLLWDDTAGMFRDNETTNMYPQDGNSLAVLYNLTENVTQNTAISEGLTAYWTDLGPLGPELNDTIIPFVGGFEIQAHWIAGNGERALDLLRREWGYMLYTNISVQSTLLEGFTANGSLGYRSSVGYDYDSSYTSHSHGWSTGPTSALTFYLLGLQIKSPRGATWSIAPVPSGLNSAEGGFETELGWFGMKWTLIASDRTVIYRISTPKGTSGVVSLPLNGSYELDGGQSGSVGPFEMDGGEHTVVQFLLP